MGEPKEQDELWAHTKDGDVRSGSCIERTDSGIMEWLFKQTKDYPGRGVEECFLRIIAQFKKLLREANMSSSCASDSRRIHEFTGISAGRIRRVLNGEVSGNLISLGEIVRIANALGAEVQVSIVKREGEDS